MIYTYCFTFYYVSKYVNFYLKYYIQLTDVLFLQILNTVTDLPVSLCSAMLSQMSGGISCHCIHTIYNSYDTLLGLSEWLPASWVVWNEYLGYCGCSSVDWLSEWLPACGWSGMTV